MAIVIPFALAVILAGCSKPEVEFQRHVETLRRHLGTNELARPITYDIRKTDSLVSPLVGQIEYIEINRRFNNIHGPEWMGGATRFTLAYQHRIWVLTRVERKPVHSWEPLDEQRLTWMEYPAEEGYQKQMLGIK